MNILEGTVALLALTAFVLLLTNIATLLSLRNARRKRTTISYIQEARYRAIFRSIASISKHRTGLTENLIRQAMGAESDPNFHERVDEFIQHVCDEVQIAISEYTEADCVVTIKALIPLAEGGGDYGITTVSRDRHSVQLRKKIYSDIEPYSYKDHSLIAQIVTSVPRRKFVHCNDLHALGSLYRNPYRNWRYHFNASAVHLIGDPTSDDNDSVYGFLMVDNKVGKFDDGPLLYLMETFSTIIYFAVHASAAVDLINELGGQSHDNKKLIGTE